MLQHDAELQHRGSSWLGNTTKKWYHISHAGNESGRSAFGVYFIPSTTQYLDEACVTFDDFGQE